MANLNYTAAQIDALLAKADTAVQPETVGDLSELETTDKDSVVDAINELFTSVSDGKSALAAAITDKGVATAATNTFADMAQNIEDIPTGGGSSYTKIASQDLTVNTSSTSVTSVGTVSLGSTAWTAAKILYIRIRDKAGARNGYFVGSDNYIFNYMAAGGATTGTDQVVARQMYSKNSSGAWGSSNSTYGVYVASIAADGTLTISARYNSSSSRTINGTYNVTVYTLDYAPDQGNPFDYSF